MKTKDSTFSRVVVPLDGTVEAEGAIPLATEIADRSGGSVRLVRVHTPPRIPATCHQVLGPRIGGELKRQQSEARRRDEAYLDDARDRPGYSPGADVSTELLRGPVGASLIEHIRHSDATFVVMSVPLSRAGRSELGEAEDTVVRGCTTPILLLRPEGRSARDDAQPIRRVLVPLDGTERSEAILEPAEALARLFGASVTLVQVVRKDDPDRSREDEARAYLDGLADGLRSRGVPCDRLVGRGSPVRAILDAATARNSDVVAMASRCRGPLTRMVLGSVSDQVLQRTSAAVLVVNQSG
ncbi:MAG: universal stress protein [Gemmatimonadota bacterium]|jgi:nucleotide-binding universal stress UspA family protein